METGRVLIVDNENLASWAIAKMLRKNGHQVDIANSGTAARLRLSEFAPDLVILDTALPDMDGLDLLREIKAVKPDFPVIIMTADYHSDLAFQAFSLGAEDYIGKPFNIDKVEHVIQKIYAREDHEEEIAPPQATRRRQKYQQDRLVGNCPSMVELFKTISACARNDCKTVLILGESGTGKELVARAVHDQSARKNEPFVEVNCASIPDNLLENELFGHEKGAYTDAGNSELGIFELAEGGTVFLDEIGDMPLNMQTKVLKVIENRRFRRLGGQRDIEVDVRIIAATNQDLTKMVEEGRFRGDLLYRLNMMCLELKPLRQRKKCIPSMVEYFIDQLNCEYGRAVKGISADALRLLMSYDWPGNVRELRNAIERAMILEKSKILSVEHFCQESRAQKLSTDDCIYGCSAPVTSTIILPPEGINIEEVEKEYIRQALVRYAGNQTKAAKCLGLSLDTLRYRRKKFGLENYRTTTPLAVDSTAIEGDLSDSSKAVSD